MTFNILEYIETDSKGRAQCPCCLAEGKAAKNLSVRLDGAGAGAYKCFRGHTPNEIRSALGASHPARIPPPPQPKRYEPPAQTFSPQDCAKYHAALMGDGAVAIAARAWLAARGLGEPEIERHRLGLRRKRVRGGMVYAITIPICVDPENGRYLLKERIQPWAPPPDSPPWIYQGGGPVLWRTYAHHQAEEIWLCAGEWDAMRVAQLAHQENAKIQCWTNTTGEGAIPDLSPLQSTDLPIKIFYDRDDPGQAGAAKVAQAIGTRATCYLVPSDEDPPPPGWDVSDAIAAGFTLDHFRGATRVIAPDPPSPPKEIPKRKALRDRLVRNDLLMSTAPETIEYLVPELLPCNELFIVAAPPRGGKSLLMMALAHAVATGGKFMDRPCCQGSVIYVNLEDGPAKIRQRQEFQAWGEGLPIWWIDDFKLSEINELIEICHEIEPSLIILDTLSRVKSGGDEGADMTPILEPLQIFAKQQDCSVVAVHHTRKLSADALESVDPFDLIRGHSSIRATARGAWLLAKGEHNDRLIVEHGNGKHDLAIHLNPANLIWTVLGKWKPAADQSMRDRVLDYLTIEGEATNQQIAAALGCNQRSLATVLWRLQSDDLISKRAGGGPKPAVYSRSVNKVSPVDAFVDASNPDDAGDTALCQQKIDNFSPDTVIKRSDPDHFVPQSPDHPQVAPGVDGSPKNAEPHATPPTKASTKASTTPHFVDAVDAFEPDQIKLFSDQDQIMTDQRRPSKNADPSWGDPPEPVSEIRWAILRLDPLEGREYCTISGIQSEREARDHLEGMKTWNPELVRSCRIVSHQSGEPPI